MLEKKPKDFFRNQLHPYFKSIEEAACCILNLPCKKQPFNPYQFVNQKFNQKNHPGAVNETLQALIIYWSDIKNPWMYANAILKTVNGNWNEKDYIDKHENIKKEFAVFVSESEDIRHLLRNIGGG